MELAEEGSCHGLHQLACRQSGNVQTMYCARCGAVICVEILAED